MTHIPSQKTQGIIAIIFLIIITEIFIFINFFGVNLSVAHAQDAEPKKGSEIKSCAEETIQGEYCIPIAAPFVKKMEGGAFKPVISIRGTTGMEVFGSYISTIYQYMASIIGIICVTIIVISGTQMILGGISNKNISEAKDRMFKAVSSLILLFLIGLILKTMNPGFYDPKKETPPQPQSQTTDQPETP